PSGTGVGLAMSYRIVQLHDGSIDFSSEPNRGTTFRLTLPGGRAYDGSKQDARRGAAATEVTA
ncbi:MAG TPA: ATP-binding protein, partial [Terriglobia bacterium]|nr:ATP-binding protein [Terriglobia bacterium]